MNIPDLDTFRGSTKARAAVWLATRVGEGNIFTKKMLRSAFPQVSQIDRRVRDLRNDDWVIHTNREDVTLGAGEQRLVKVGAPVWDRNYRRAGAARGRPSATQRQAILAADDYTCALCGVSGGERYPDDELRKAVLTLLRIDQVMDDGQGWLTVCERCSKGQPKLASTDTVAEEFAQLGSDQQELVRSWLLGRPRQVEPAERAWRALRLMPAEARDRITSGRW